MRLYIGALTGLAVTAAVAAGSAGWMQKSQSGLRQLMTGTVAAVGSPGAEQLSDLAWRAPGDTAGLPAIALSEQDWLKLSEDVAPVSYLGPSPVKPAAPPANDAQPL